MREDGCTAAAPRGDEMRGGDATDGAAGEYRRRRRLREAARERFVRTDARLSYGRLGVFAVGTGLSGLALAGMVTWWSLVAPVGVFAGLAIRHHGVVRRAQEAARAVAFYDRGLARVRDEWAGRGEAGERFQDDGHLYARDLDLFGRGSLFDLLSLARTRAGEEALAGWLRRPAPVDEVLRRQDAVRELRCSLDLREDLSLAGADLRAGVDTEALVSWAEDAGRPRSGWLRVAAAIVSSLTVAAGGLWVLTGAPAAFVIAVAIQLCFAFAESGRIRDVVRGVEGPAQELGILLHVLVRLERETFRTSRLEALGGRLECAGVRASDAIRKLQRLVEMNDWQRNSLFAPLAALLLWGTHVGWAIDAWRLTHGMRVRGWLEAVGELEAFASLSAYHYEHPEDPFPEMESGRAGVFVGGALGHPLLAARDVVRNDVTLAGSTGLLIVSGSNMSGKSTLLRTVGVNAVLAQAGAPVRAGFLRMSSMELGATLRIEDSLREGRSRFYAEIKRIREISEVAEEAPVLFLLDEIFHGTNSDDRLVGASGVLTWLLDRGAIGLVTTHDLALTRIAGTRGSNGGIGMQDGGNMGRQRARMVNVHFDDEFDGGTLRFDYRMKPGPVNGSNAIALMRAVGLTVDMEDVRLDGAIMAGGYSASRECRREDRS